MARFGPNSDDQYVGYQIIGPARDDADEADEADYIQLRTDVWYRERTIDAADENAHNGIKLEQTLIEAQDAIQRIAWSPSGRYLAAASREQKLYLYDLERRETRSITLQDRTLPVLAFSSNSQVLAVATAQGDLTLFDVSGEADTVFERVHDDYLLSIAFDLSGRYLATSGRDGKICIRDLKTGNCTRHERPGAGIPCHITWTANGRKLACAYSDGYIAFIDLSKRASAPSGLLDAHESWVTCVQWLPNSGLFLSASQDMSVKVWSERRKRPILCLEGSISAISSLSISVGGELFASQSETDITLWRVSDWTPVAYLHEFAERGWYAGVAFHPSKPLLATIGSDAEGHEARVVRLWQYDRSLLVTSQPAKRRIAHCSAKIVLVGESNVGKSCLALRLAEDRFGVQPSTHGMRLWCLPPERFDCGSGNTAGKEIFVWDMGGQEEYRLVHQLFLHDTSLALVLFDPTRGKTALDEADSWNRRLDRQLAGRKATKLLVGAKVDEPTQTIDYAAIQRFRASGGFTAYIETSAKTDRGIAELRDAIARGLHWENLTVTNRPEEFQQIRDAVEQRRLAGDVVVSVLELQRRLDVINSANFQAVIRQLALQGVVALTHMSNDEEALILQIGEIERYAGSLIIAARNSPNGVPAIDERLLGSGAMVFPGIAASDRLPRLQERAVVDCVVHLLIVHGICFRHQGLLVFPSLFRRDAGPSNEPPARAVALYYDFSGAVDNIYASLVASLAVHGRFGRVRLSEDRAEFERADEGAFGVRTVARGRGLAHLEVYFEAGAAAAEQKLFMSFVDDHLRSHGVEIKEHLNLVCACGHHFEEDILRRRIALGHHDVGCPECDARALISEGVSAARKSDPDLTSKTWALRTEVGRKTEQSAQAARRAMQSAAVDFKVPRPIRILHLSDLHMTAQTDVVAAFQPLSADIRESAEGLGFGELDYLVVSGDLTSRGAPAEFEVCHRFLTEIIGAFHLNAERCIIVPGNHDVSWDEEVYEWVPLRKWQTMSKPDQHSYVVQEKGVLVRNSANYAARFRNFSDCLYHPLLQKPFPLDTQRDGASHLFPEHRLQFVCLNSASEVDEYFPKRSGIQTSAMSHCLLEANARRLQEVQRGSMSKDKPLLRIAVWHHPLLGEDALPCEPVVNTLTQNGIRVVLHGHVHEERAELLGWQYQNPLVVMGAGAFGARAQERPDGAPRSYNLLEIAPDLSSVEVHTRAMRKGVWGPWAIWPSGNANSRKTSYTAPLPQ